MNKLWKRILSFFLIFCMLLPCGAAQAYAAEEKEVTERYMEGVIKRYDEYRKGDYNDTYLTDRSRYTYCAWTDSVYEMTTCEEVRWDDSADKSFWEKLQKLSKDLDEQAAAQLAKAFTWAGHVLTDTKLDKEAYIKYLSNIIAMHEKGFLETAASQAEYTATVNVGSEVKKIFKTALGAAKNVSGDKKDGNGIVAKVKVKLKDLMGEKQLKKMESAYKTFDKYYKLTKKAMSIDKALTTEIQNAAEAQAIATYLSLYEERTAFLEVLRDEAEPGSPLYEAAQAMIDASDMRMMGLIMADPKERADNFLKISSYGEKDFQKFADETMQYVTVAASAWMAKYSKQMAAAFLTGMKTLTTSVSLVTAGFQIGGALGRIFWGDQYEMAREMLIMDEMGTILATEVSRGDQKFINLMDRKDTEKNYENLVSHVSVAESLCYIHLRGEYCVTEYTKKVEDSDAEAGLNMVYERDIKELNRVYQGLAAVFPEPRNVENNGGQAVGYQGNVYYWKYGADSFNSDGLFASYNYNQDAHNQLVCRDGDGNETVLLTAKGNGPIFISGNRIYLKENYLNLYSVDLSGKDRVDHGAMEVWAADEQAGTLIVKKEDAGGDPVCLLQADHQLQTVKASDGQHVELTNLGVIDGYCFFSSYDAAAESPGFTIYRIPLDGSEVKYMTSVTAEESYAFGLNACQLLKVGETLYYSYGYYAGTGGFFQGGGINSMDMEGENAQVCVPYGELSAEEFLAEEGNDGETSLYYIGIGGDEVTGSYIGFWDDYPYDSCYVKTRKEGEKSWQTTQRSLNIARPGSYVCVGGEILRMNPEYMAYETLIPKEAGFGFIDKPTEQSTDFPIISQLDVVGDDVYFTVDWNVKNGKNMGWRPGYYRERSAFYTMKIGDTEAKELYSY